MKSKQISSESLKQVRHDTVQIVRGSDEYARLEALSHEQLSALAHEHEIAAMTARHHLLSRQGASHRNN